MGKQKHLKKMAGPTTPATIYVYAFLAVGAIAMMGTAIGTIYWLHVSFPVTDTEIRFGLFSFCVNDVCIDYTDTALTSYHLGELDPPKGLCITAVVLYCLSFVIMGHLVFGKNMTVTSKNHGWITLAIMIFAGILAFSGTAKFADLNDLDTLNTSLSWNYGYSFYLSAASGTLAVLAGVFSLIAVTSLVNAQGQSGGVIFQPSNPVAPGVHVVPANSYGYPPNSYGYPPNVATVQYPPGPNVMGAPTQGYGMNQAPIEIQKPSPAY